MAVLVGDVASTVSRSHGVTTRARLLAAGVTRHQIQRALDRGELIAAHPSVYRSAAAPRTWHQGVLIAVLAAGPGALASHRSAAALWGLDGSTQGVPEVVAPRHHRSWAATLGRAHESKDLHLAEPTERMAIPCTGLVRTLVDLGAVVHPVLLQQTVDDAVRSQMCTWDDLLHAVAMHSRKGRNGVGALRAVIEECYGQKVPDSQFNRLVERLLIAHGLRPTPELVVRNAAGREIGRIDLAFPAERVGIELDSRRHHLNSIAFEQDRCRQNELELLGWMILRFTWRQYRQAPEGIVSVVRRALDSRA